MKQSIRERLKKAQSDLLRSDEQLLRMTHTMMALQKADPEMFKALAVKAGLLGDERSD